MLLLGQLLNLESNSRTHLVWQQPTQNLPTLLDYNRITAPDNTAIIYLPNATLTNAVQTIVLYNIGGFSVEIHRYNEDEDLINLPAGAAYQFNMVDSSTEGGTWEIFPYVNGAAPITSFNVTSLDNSVVITGSPLNVNNGTITLNTPAPVTGFNSLPNDQFGFITFKSIDGKTGNYVYNASALDSDGNIVITNNDGTQNGSTVFSLAPVISTNQATIGNVKITGDSITDSNPLTINGVTFAGSGSLTGNITSPSVPIAWVRFTDTPLETGNVLAVQDSYNVSAVNYVTSGQGGSYTLTISAFDNQYGVSGTAGTSSTTPALLIQPVYGACTNTQCQFVVTDSGGTPVSAAPDGIFVELYSSSGMTGGGSSNFNRSYASLRITPTSTEAVPQAMHNTFRPLNLANDIEILHTDDMSVVNEGSFYIITNTSAFSKLFLMTYNIEMASITNPIRLVTILVAINNDSSGDKGQPINVDADNIDVPLGYSRLIRLDAGQIITAGILADQNSGTITVTHCNFTLTQVG